MTVSLTPHADPSTGLRKETLLYQIGLCRALLNAMLYYKLLIRGWALGFFGL